MSAAANSGNTAKSTTTHGDITSQLTKLEREADSALSPARRFWARGLPTAVAHLTALLIIGEAALSAWLGWETGSWPDTVLVVEAVLVASIFLLVGVGVLLMAVFAPRLATAPSPSHVLFEAALSGDERLAPLAEPQPEPLPPVEVSDAPMRLGPLPLASTARRDEARSAIFPLSYLCFLVAQFLMIGPANAIWLRRNSDNGWSLSLAVALLALIGISGVVVTMVSQTFQKRAPLARVTVDARGVRWRASWLAGWRHIAWDKARAFARITYPIVVNSASLVTLPTNLTATAYILDAPGAMLLWSLPNLESAPTYQPAQRLIQFVTARTQLPLHDLSALANDLTQPKADAARVLADRVGEGNVANLPAAFQALTQPIRRTTAAYLLLAYLAFMSLALWALVGLGVYFLWSGTI